MSDTPQPNPPPRRRRRVWRAALAFFGLLVVLVGGAIWYALSESGLPFLIARVVAQSGGRLSVEGISGSVGSSMRFARLTWSGADTTVEATDVVVEWSPGALWRKELVVRGLGAGRVSIAMKPRHLDLPPIGKQPALKRFRVRSHLSVLALSKTGVQYESKV